MEIVETSCSARATRALAGATICLLAAGCATPVPADFCKALEPESVMPQHSYEVKQGAPLVYAKHELAQKAIGYAVFSNNAYDKSETFMALPDGWQDFCDVCHPAGRSEAGRYPANQNPAHSSVARSLESASVLLLGQGLRRYPLPLSPRHRCQPAQHDRDGHGSDQIGLVPDGARSKHDQTAGWSGQSKVRSGLSGGGESVH